MITITGLTTRQVKLLDTMWAIDGYDEYMEWKSTQNTEEVNLLEEMVLLAEIDQMVESEQGVDVSEIMSRYRG